MLKLTVEGCTNLDVIDHHSEVKLPDVSTQVHKCVCVVLHKQVLEHTALRHQSEQVVVAAEEHVQAHLQHTEVSQTAVSGLDTMEQICSV